MCQKLKLIGSLNEPNGVCITNDRVYISDTNNHSIKIIHNFDLNETEFQLEELKINSFIDTLQNLNLNPSNGAYEIWIELNNIELNLDAQNAFIINFK